MFEAEKQMLRKQQHILRPYMHASVDVNDELV